MNKYGKITYSIAALALLAGAVATLAMPDEAAAKWLGFTQRYGQRLEAVAHAEPAPAPVRAAVETESDEAVATVEVGGEAAVTGPDGKTARVIVEDAADDTKVIKIDEGEAGKLQATADEGRQSWLLDPVQVVKRSAADYGFSAERDTFTLVSQLYKGARSGTGEAQVLVGHDSRFFLVKLIQPAGPGTHNIWQVAAVRQVRAVVRDEKPDVGPGVAGLDYAKIIKWQQAVDAGRDQWRLDPLEVAKREGKSYYGFGDDDTFTVVNRRSATPLARHGQVDVAVKHGDKVYKMIVVRPFGGGGAIWTTYRVDGPVTAPVPQPPAGKVIFRTDEYKGWNWYKGAYPGDMAMAVITDYAQAGKDGRIPEAVLARAKAVDYDEKVVLFAYLGSGGGADAIGIEKVTLTGNALTVTVRTRSVKPGEMETRNLTAPSDYVAIDRKYVDVWGGVNVTFVDQRGNELAKTKVSINHNPHNR
ncbi:hypothetical protein [Anaeroselena agilis]|uniref:Uncharacterized protein n=1 Tax=Anaeroselena agilis TaxID=3063788 RepID=A0ABU3P285_9FIRM|nr:hypothetical protein [Selenomonadales bacterium 4137-cl]